MHEMLTILTDVHGVCLSVSLSVTWLQSAAAPCAMCAGSFGAAFAKCLWPLVLICCMSGVYGLCGEYQHK